MELIGEISITGSLQSFYNLMVKLEAEYPEGWRKNLWFSETFKPVDSAKNPAPGRAAWTLHPDDFLYDGITRRAGIEAYEIGQFVKIKFIDGYSPIRNAPDGFLAGTAPPGGFEPIGKLFVLFYDFIEEELRKAKLLYIPPKGNPGRRKLKDSDKEEAIYRDTKAQEALKLKELDSSLGWKEIAKEINWRYGIKAAGIKKLTRSIEDWTKKT